MHSKLQNLEAIVIGSSMYGDSDKIITFYTKERGKVRGIAKGVKKLTSRKRSALEPFTHVRVQITNSDLGIVTEASLINSFSNIRKDINSVSVAYFLCESIQKSQPDEATNYEVFSLFLNSLKDLEDGSSKRSVREDFTKNLLLNLGFLEEAEGLTDSIKVFEEIIERKLGSVRVGKQLQK